MLTRISSILGALALSGVLVASTYGAQAAKPQAHPAQHGRQVATARFDHFVAPVPHQYRTDGLRMGLHCESAGMAMP
ncbi:MAG: hypothetical protein WAV00_09180 [Nocardioides sp.]